MSHLKEGRMPTQGALISILATGALVAFALAGWGGGFAGPTLAALIAQSAPQAVAVDTELVIAVDVSNSMDPEEQELQRDGYVSALTSREFMQALREGSHGKVAVTYFEWAGLYDQKILMPWRLIDGPEAADAVAAEIARAPYRRAPRTDLWRAAVRAAAVRRQRLSRRAPCHRRLRRRRQQYGPAGHADARRGAGRRHHH
jgi:hypothetical protein